MAKTIDGKAKIAKVHKGYVGSVSIVAKGDGSEGLVHIRMGSLIETKVKSDGKKITIPFDYEAEFDSIEVDAPPQFTDVAVTFDTVKIEREST